MSKKTIGILIVLATLGIILLVSKPLLFLNSTYGELYDDKDKIISLADSYSYINRVGSSRNNKTELSFNLSGMETLWTIKSEKQDSIEIEYSSDIKTGDLKLVMIYPNDDVKNIFEGSGKNKVKVPIQSGKNRIKIVGRQAKGTIDFTILAKNGIKAIPRN